MLAKKNCIMAHTKSERISYPAKLVGSYGNGTKKKSRNDKE
jgi:hypothetical protein